MVVQEEKRSNNKKQKNNWKYAFFTLAITIILFFVIIGIQLFSPGTATQTDSVITNNTAKTVPFEIRGKKEDINDIVAYYIQDLTKDNDIKYALTLTNKAELTGTFPIFGHDVDFQLFFDPFVTEDGNVQLKATNLSVGALNLPISYVLDFVAKKFDLPKWVKVHAKEQYILFQLNEFYFNKGTQISAEKFDLEKDDIRLKVYLPIGKPEKADE